MIEQEASIANNNKLPFYLLNLIDRCHSMLSEALAPSGCLWIRSCDWRLINWMMVMGVQKTGTNNNKNGRTKCNNKSNEFWRPPNTLADKNVWNNCCFRSFSLSHTNTRTPIPNTNNWIGDLYRNTQTANAITLPGKCCKYHPFTNPWIRFVCFALENALRSSRTLTATPTNLCCTENACDMHQWRSEMEKIILLENVKTIGQCTCTLYVCVVHWTEMFVNYLLFPLAPSLSLTCHR